MDYEITSSTLIIMASELGSIVYDYEGKHLIKLSTGKLIEDNCKNYGSSFKGRKDGTKALTGIRYKTPIIISELNRIIFFPTTSTRKNDCIWVSLNNIKKYYKKNNNTVVVFNNDLVIELDPGMAFGTGTHETTSMCIRELENYVDETKTVFDIGCGSGILAIAAAQLGAKEVVAGDLDEVAVKVSKENCEINHVSDKVVVKHGSLFEVVDSKADVIVANIIADIIKILAKDVSKFLKDDGVFISSGIILAKIDEVCQALEENGFEIVKVERLGEWSAIVSKLK